MPDTEIYLSLVVTARNDDHGGSLLSRMQAFVNGWIGQCQRYQLSAELIVVDWNPPADRPPLIAALNWPKDPEPCQVRFIQVPPEIHRKFRHAEHLPLYQMIAKNVGIRRARGRFVLATNIDILFSDELVRFLAERRLEPGRMYRIDRHDVMSDVPVNAPVDNQLEYCRSHLIRVNAREGTFILTPDGRRATGERDIAAPDSAISFGCGWYGVESHSSGEVFRWVSNDAEVFVNMPSGCPALVFDLEPGPGVKRQPFVLQVTNADLEVLAAITVRGRTRVELRFPSEEGGTEQFLLRALGGGATIAEDPRIMNFRVYSCRWSAAQGPTKGIGSATTETRIQPEMRNGSASKLKSLSASASATMKQNENGCSLASKPVSLPDQASGFWKRVRNVLRESGRGDPDSPFVVTIPGWFRHGLHAYYSEGGVSGVARWGLKAYLRPGALVAAASAGHDIFEPDSNILPGRGWYDLEHFRGETFRWIRNDAELIVRRPGANEVRLAMHVEPGPGLDWKPFELLVRDGERVISRNTVNKLQYLEIALPLHTERTQILTLHVEGGDRPYPNDPRRLNFRVFWCGWSGSSSGAAPLPLSKPLPNIPVDSGLALGAGWQPVTDDAAGETCCSAHGHGEILVQCNEGVPKVLRLELAIAGSGPQRLEVSDACERIVAAGDLHGRQICYLTLPIDPGPTQVFNLRLRQGELRIYRLGWADEKVDIVDFAAGFRTGAGWSPLAYTKGEISRTIEDEAELELTVPAGSRRYLSLEMEATTSGTIQCSVRDASAASVAQFSVEGRKTVYVEIPWEPGLRACFRLIAPQARVYRCTWSAYAGQPGNYARHFRCEGVMADSTQDIVGSDIGLGVGWYAPECSNGEVFRWAANQAEVFIEGSPLPKALLLEVEAGPSLNGDSFVLQVLDRSWRVVGEFQVAGRKEIRLELPQSIGLPNVYRLVADGGGLPVADDPRILDFRVFRLEGEQSEATQSPGPKWRARILDRPRERVAAKRPEAHTVDPVGAVHLHTNACGDFTLMSREHWFDLRAYPEFDMYSFHIDSILCYAAHHGGAREEILKEPMRIYHIEHGLGSGWTPEGQAKLFDRLRANGIRWIEYQELVGWAAQMRKLNSPLIFNRENWGLADVELPETFLDHCHQNQAAHHA